MTNSLLFAGVLVALAASLADAKASRSVAALLNQRLSARSGHRRQAQVELFASLQGKKKKCKAADSDGSNCNSKTQSCCTNSKNTDRCVYAYIEDGSKPGEYQGSCYQLKSTKMSWLLFGGGPNTQMDTKWTIERANEDKDSTTYGTNVELSMERGTEFEVKVGSSSASKKVEISATFRGQLEKQVDRFTKIEKKIECSWPCKEGEYFWVQTLSTISAYSDIVPQCSMVACTSTGYEAPPKCPYGYCADANCSACTSIEWCDDETDCKALLSSTTSLSEKPLPISSTFVTSQTADLKGKSNCRATPFDWAKKNLPGGTATPIGTIINAYTRACGSPY